MDDILASIRRILSDEEKAAKNTPPSDDVLKLEPSMMVDEEGATSLPEAHHEMNHEVPVIPVPPEAASLPAQSPLPNRVEEPQHAAELARASMAAGMVDHMDAGSGGRTSADTGHPDSGHQDTGHPDAGHPDGGHPNIRHPDTRQPGEGLLAPEAAAQAASSVGTLMRTLMSERHAVVHRGGPTIEDLVREELRPLLKGWLDRHLPDLVERLVRAEIERVVGRITG